MILPDAFFEALRRTTESSPSGSRQGLFITRMAMLREGHTLKSGQIGICVADNYVVAFQEHRGGGRTQVTILVVGKVVG